MFFVFYIPFFCPQHKAPNDFYRIINCILPLILFRQSNNERNNMLLIEALSIAISYSELKLICIGQR